MLFESIVPKVSNSPSSYEEFTQQLQKSLSCIETSLFTSINFEGTPPMLLVDELQFLLNAGCVTIDCPPDVTFGNILGDEKATLIAWTKQYPWLEASAEPLNKGLTVLRKEFPSPPSNSASDEPLRLALSKVSSAYQYTLSSHVGEMKDWKVTIYFEPEAVLSRFWNVPEFAKYVEEGLRLVTTKFDPARRLRLLETETLYRRFYNSSYLTSVLDTLQQRIDEHLRQQDSRFASRSAPGFFIQFFLVSDLDEGHHHRLRYFPMPDERPALRDPRTTGQIENLLRDAGLPVPEDITKFITEEYLWTADNAFVGYCCDTAASLYLADWQSEPRAQGVHLDEIQQQQRQIATVIFQTLRSNTPHQFLLPLFASMRPIGVVVINCPDEIDAQSRLLPIRSARDLGYVLTMALKTDNIVNHLQEKKLQAEAVRSYKHITHSILHTEGTYCMEIEQLLKELSEAQLTTAHPKLVQHVKRLSFIVREKKSLINEFRATHDPVREVPAKLLYPMELGYTADKACVTLTDLRNLTEMLKEIFCRDSTLNVSVKLGAGLETRGRIPNFDYYVLARILANLINNSRRVAQIRLSQLTQHGVSSPELTLQLNIINGNGGEELSIVAVDNCGGFEMKDIAFPWEVTFKDWSRYLEENAETTGGMGFFMFARYVLASKGVCQIDNILQPQVGARVQIKIPLRSQSPN